MERDSANSNYDLKQQTTAIPSYGMKVKFNHTFPEKRTQNLRPSFRQSWPLLPLVYR